MSYQPLSSLATHVAAAEDGELHLDLPSRSSSVTLEDSTSQPQSFSFQTQRLTPAATNDSALHEGVSALLLAAPAAEQQRACGSGGGSSAAGQPFVVAVAGDGSGQTQQQEEGATLLLLQSCWVPLLALFLSSTIALTVFPFFTYVPSSGLIGESLPKVGGLTCHPAARWREFMSCGRHSARLLLLLCSQHVSSTSLPIHPPTCRSSSSPASLLTSWAASCPASSSWQPSPLPRCCWSPASR